MHLLGGRQHVPLAPESDAMNCSASTDGLALEASETILRSRSSPSAAALGSLSMARLNGQETESEPLHDPISTTALAPSSATRNFAWLSTSPAAPGDTPWFAARPTGGDRVPAWPRHVRRHKRAAEERVCASHAAPARILQGSHDALRRSLPFSSDCEAATWTRRICWTWRRQQSAQRAPICECCCATTRSLALNLILNRSRDARAAVVVVGATRS